MRLRAKGLSAGAALLAAAGAGVFCAPLAAARQANVSRAGTRPAGEVLARIGQSAGVAIVADSTVTERIPLPATPATAGTVEQRIADVVKALPPGTTWAKLYLPAPAAGRTWNGDDVAAYALAQAKLFGAVGAAPAGTVEILGQRVPAEKAGEYVAGLNLKPVYLVTNPSKRAAVAAGAPNQSQWAQMSPEQRQQYAQQEAAQIVAMDPATRQRTVQQMMAVFGQVMRQMTPEQRQEVFQGQNVQIRVETRTPGPP